MGTAYTPGLTVSPRMVVRRARRLPLRGAVLVDVGAHVEPGTVVGSATTNGGAKLELNSHTSSTASTSWRIQHETDTYGAGNLVFLSAPSQPTRSAFVYAERMRLDTSGNFGLGTPVISSFGHGGTNVITQIHNSGSTLHSQSHLILSSSVGSIPSSSIGTVSWGLPVSGTGSSGLMGYVGMMTASSHTAGASASDMVFATKSTTDGGATRRMILDSFGDVQLGINSNPFL